MGESFQFSNSRATLRVSLGVESQKIARIAESQREKQIAREEGKRDKGQIVTWSWRDEYQ
jgi:hypothetical protein